MTEITLTVRIEDDPSVFPITDSGIGLYADVAERPVLGVRHVNVDPCQVGQVVLGLLHASQLDQEGGAS